MKTIKYIITFILFVTPFLQGCQKASINGDLDGQWEVIEISPEVENIEVDERLFYNFYLHVCQLTYYGGYFLDGDMTFNGETLWIDFPYELENKQLITLKQYGINKNPVVFDVEFPSKNRLILKNEDVMIVLKKF